MFTHAQINFLGHVDDEFFGLEIGALVFAVAPGLGVGESAAAIIIDARI